MWCARACTLSLDHAYKSVAQYTANAHVAFMELTIHLVHLTGSTHHSLKGIGHFSHIAGRAVRV